MHCRLEKSYPLLLRLPSSIPAPSLLKLGGDVAADFERLRSEWATEFVDSENERNGPPFFSPVSFQRHMQSFEPSSLKMRTTYHKSQRLFNLLSFTASVKQKLRKNVSSSISEYRNQVRSLMTSCLTSRRWQKRAHSNTWKTLICDRIDTGIREEPTRRLPLQQKKLTLSKATDLAKASEATSR
jgi:hypothetical protein